MYRRYGYYPRYRRRRFGNNYGYGYGSGLALTTGLLFGLFFL